MKGDRKERQADYKRPRPAPQKTDKPIAPLRTISVKTFSEVVAEKWHKWTTREKIFYVSLILLSMGCSAYVLSKLVPVIIFNLNVASSTSLTKPELHQSKIKQYQFFSSDRTNTATFSDSKIQSVVTTVKIDIAHDDIAADPHVRSLSQIQRKTFLNSLEKQKKLIRKVLPDILPKELLTKVLSNPSFSILLVSPDSIPGVMARYDEVPNTIYIAWDLTPNEQELLFILKNEAHHLAIRYTNWNKLSVKKFPKDTSLMADAYLGADGKKDVRLAEELNTAIKNGDKRIKEFFNLYIKWEEQGSLSLTEQKILDGYVEIAAEHNPIIYKIKLTRSELADRIRTGSILKVTGENQYILPVIKNPMYPNDLFIKTIDSDIQEDVVVLRGTFAESQHLQDIIIAFFADTMGSRSRYQTGHYATLGKDKDYINSEIASDLEMLNTSVRDGFYPEVCQYFNSYHNLENHDEDKTPRSGML